MDKEYLLTAIRAALSGGREIMEVYDDPAADFEIERKSDNSPLTIADRRSHSVIAEMLGGTPYPVLSEEGRMIPYAERCVWRELWVVDPLDGTKEFIKRNGEFTVNIAFVHDGVAEAGVIYIPVKDVLYFADYDMGAYRTEAADEVTSLEELIGRSVRLPLDRCHEGFTVVASRSHLNAETAEFIREMEVRHERVNVVSKGSSLKLCLVAEGVADVYPRFAPTMEWDTAAGHAIVRAAGKEVRRAQASGESLRAQTSGAPTRERRDKREEVRVGETDVCAGLSYNKEDLMNPWFVAE